MRGGKGRCHREEEEGEGEMGGPTVWRKRERGEGWYHREEEEGEGERGGPTVWRKSEKGRGG